MLITSAAGLVDALQTHRVLSPAQLEQVKSDLQSRFPEPRALAKELLQRGWLTVYQVNNLLQGRGGELLLGPYLLLERLGEGGMGQVFKARHQLMDRTVALKVIRKERLADGDAVQRFQREIRMAAQLNHPHIVQAYEAGQVGETHFLVMEYAEGTDLQRLVQKSGPLPIGQACDCIRQAAAGLEHAAARGLVHRDIKPSNLQITAHGTVVKILDMGLARTQAPDGEAGQGTQLTQQRMVLGTPDYIAPEQVVDARQVDIRADIYSLGCTLYFLLAGRPPFPGGTWDEKLSYHRKVEPQAIEQVRSDVPAALGAVLRKMMAKRPEGRYTTPAEIAVALAPFSQLTASLPTMDVALPRTAQASTIAAPQVAGSMSDPIASLVDKAAVPEGGWTLQANSTVCPPPVSVTQMQPVTPFSEPTLLAPTPSPARTGPGQPISLPPTQASAVPGKRYWIFLAVGNAVLGLLILLILLWPKGGSKEGSEEANVTKPKDQPRTTSAEATVTKPKPGLPHVLIDEDFRTTYENKLAIPVGWKSDEFRVVKNNDLHGLEVSKPAGVASLTIPLSAPLSGNFSVEGMYHMDHPNFGQYHALTISLENRKKSAPLPVTFDWAGKVVIASDTRLPPPSYKPLLPTHFLLRREGKRLRVFLNQDPVADKDLDEVAEFDTLRLALNGGPGNAGRLARLYGLKVASLPP